MVAKFNNNCKNGGSISSVEVKQGHVIVKTAVKAGGLTEWCTVNSNSVRRRGTLEDLSILLSSRFLILRKTGILSLRLTR